MNNRVEIPHDPLAAGPFRLVPLTMSHWKLEHQLSRCTDVAAWTLYPPELNETQARERVIRSQQAAGAGQAARYAVERNGTALGTAGIKNTEDAPEIFYALLPAGRGRGAATAAAVALSDWALDHDAPYVALWTLPGNSASARVAQRAGFFSAEGDHSNQGDFEGPRLWTRFML